MRANRRKRQTKLAAPCLQSPQKKLRCDNMFMVAAMEEDEVVLSRQSRAVCCSKDKILRQFIRKGTTWSQAWP